MGWLHLRFEHDRSPCSHACGSRPLQHRSPQGLHAFLLDRHCRGDANPGGGHDAYPVARADGPAARVLWLPGAGILRLPATQAQHGRIGVCQVPRTDDSPAGGCPRRHCRHAVSNRVLWPSFVAYPWLVREAHQDRQPAGGFCGRASACKSLHVRQLPEPAPGLRRAGRPGLPVEPQQRLLVPLPLRLYRSALLGQDVPIGPHLRSHRVRGCWNLVRLPDGSAP
mmetsp:Transcript_35396/g.56966  ORF Transcript_35396/g.56966 Transcript_35396/m.56966 type:complete len:224 (-) Transcript_35396:547-1218(-)